MLKQATALLLMILAVYWSFTALIPQSFSKIDAEGHLFSTERALVHLKEISKQPHFIGNLEHSKVKDYIIKQLENLGLSTEIQEGYSYNEKWGSIVKSKNILARIKGSNNTKALMLLSHYDSNPHSSLGASDDGSGVVTILEGLRAYLSTGKTPKNDIIILISDAEELGLNGATLFVNEHPWAKDVGLILNFEARGSGGPSYMLIETNGGNHNMIEGFAKANPEYPVANSLAYSIYKMLPNDTDLTPMREIGDIEGFNFAFIDDHFDYHTALDNYQRLDRNTLEHQGSYFMPLLNYFSVADLSNLKSDKDDIYFNVPLLKSVHYPFSWITPMLILAIVLFIGLVIYGLHKKVLNGKEIAKGFIPLALVLIANGLIGYFGWTVLTSIYPEYKEILHGFTYNGHAYIWAFSFLSISVCFFIYHKFQKSKDVGSLLVAPLFLWLVICSAIAFKLKGASFFIIPLIFGLISFFFIIKQKKPYLFLLVFLSGPTLFILSPFIKMFPVGLGLKMIIASTLLITLIFILLISVFGYFDKKKLLAFASFIIAISFFISAHLNSGFKEERPKPNSLVYQLDADDNSAIWATYDTLLDEWNQAFLTDKPDEASTSNYDTFSSKYSNGFSFIKQADLKPLPLPNIVIQNATVIGEHRHIKLLMSAERSINRVEIFTDTTAIFNSFNINGFELTKESAETTLFQNRPTRSLINFYVTDEDSLELKFTIPKNQKTRLDMYEASNDLLYNPLFNIPKRTENMIPKPFVLNDAVIIKKTIAIE